VTKAQRSSVESLDEYRRRQRGGFLPFLVALAFSAISIIEAIFLIVAPASLDIFLPCIGFAFASVFNFGVLMYRFYSQSRSEIEGGVIAVLLGDDG
jgi:hypothetical protein